jgi:hypothetical protein
MSLAVIPLATGRPPAFGFRWWVQVLAHVPFVALPLVFTARYALGLGGKSRLATTTALDSPGARSEAPPLRSDTV